MAKYATKKMSQIPEAERVIVSVVMDEELGSAKMAKSAETAEFESYLGLIDSVREPKDYDWQSDIRLPEFISHFLTQLSMDVDQYFSTRDFVETYVQKESPENIKSAAATKELLNNTLNRRDLYYYNKYLRARSINYLLGNVYAICWWDQQLKPAVIGYKTEKVHTGLDINGEPYLDTNTQVPSFEDEETPIQGQLPVVDHFNFEVLDPRNVFTDSKYVYSAQQKDWIIIRSEKRIVDLFAEAASMKYVDLAFLTEYVETCRTETAKETDATENKVDVKSVLDKVDVYERWGKFWCVVEEKDAAGQPVKIRPGLGKDKKPVSGAEVLETVMTVVQYGSSKRMLRFIPTPYKDHADRPYRPIIRGLCYIHPVKDAGAGDGKHVRELQLALDDTFNVSQNRVLLATHPTLVTKKYSTEDNASVYIEPGHVIELENPREDLQDLRISDNIGGALQQMSVLKSMMQQVDSVYPTTMGDTPGMASTTATAIAGAEARSNKRSNYKALTFEYTFLTELYWMIIQMTDQYAKPITGIALMGEKVYDFNPNLEYFYKPVSSAIETEQAKQVKLQKWTQIMGYVAQIQHPDTVKLINYILGQMFTYMGDEYVNFGKSLLNPEVPIQDKAASVANQAVPNSNQAGIMMSPAEMATRGGMGGGTQ